MPAVAYEEPSIKVIPKSDWVRILVVDDDVDFLKRVKVNFELNNFTTVDTATSPEKAVEYLKLNKNLYHAVIADINFETSEISGDEFVVNNIKLFGKARILVVTGIQENTYEILKQFKALDIPIQDKLDDGWRDVISEVIEETKKERIGDIQKKLQGIATVTSIASISKTEIGVKDLLLDWLNNSSNPEEGVFLMGGNALSAFDLVEQVEEGTPLGNRLFKMFVREIRRSLKLDVRRSNGSNRKTE